MKLSECAFRTARNPTDDKRQTRITKRMAENMLVRDLALCTIDSYTYQVDRFARHLGKQPEELGREQVREFQLWMIQVNRSCWSQDG